MPLTPGSASPHHQENDSGAFPSTSAPGTAIGAPVSRHDDISAINVFANELESIANKLSSLMPAIPAADRQALSDITPEAAWDRHYGGSADPFAAARPEALRFARIESAAARPQDRPRAVETTSSVISPSYCRSPGCAGEVIPESKSDGHCGLCGLHHHCSTGAMTWNQVLGPLLVVVSAGEGYEETQADTLRFAGRYVTIHSTTNGLHHQVTVPAKAREDPPSRLTSLPLR